MVKEDGNLIINPVHIGMIGGIVVISMMCGSINMVVKNQIMKEIIVVGIVIISMMCRRLNLLVKI